METEEFINEYRKFILVRIAPLVIPTSSANYIEFRKKLVKKAPMRVFLRVIRHMSYDPNFETNSETLEFTGDALFAAVLATIVTKKIVGIDPEMLTDLKNSKLWKGELAKICENLGLSKYILSYIPVTMSDKEDMVEALFGAIHYVGDTYFGPGYGFLMCSNLFVSIFGNITANVDRLSIKSPLNTLKEIGDKLKWFSEKGGIEQFGTPKPIRDAEGTIIRYDLVYTLTDRAKEWMINNKKKIVNGGVIANVSRHGKKDTILAAVKEALVNLEKYYGVTWYVADDYNRGTATKLRDPTLQRQMKKDGVDEIEIKEYHAEDNESYSQLLGIPAGNNGPAKILVTAINNLRVKRDIKHHIVEYYKKNGMQDPLELIKISD
jgi:hypothetical protein